MSQKLQMNVKLNQSIALTQQLRQAIALLQLSTIELKLLVQQHIKDNPFIEDESEQEDHQNETKNLSKDELHYASYVSRSRNTNGDQENYDSLANMSVNKTLREHLLEQTLLCHFQPIEQMIAEAIIDSINEKGYLTLSLEAIQSIITNDTPNKIKRETIESIYTVIKTFDPCGVGATNLQDCLLIQLGCHKEKNQIWQIAKTIIEQHFDLLASHNKNKLLKKLNLTPELYAKTIHFIRSLNPFPGLQYSQEHNKDIEPELYVKKINNEWKVFLSESVLTQLKVNKQYQELIRQNKKHGSYGTLKQELEEARWLLNGIKRRNDTLLSVATHIIELQKEFLDVGTLALKPLNMIDVAASLNLHESTISRITTGKYIETPRGLFELKYFFPTQIQTQTGSCSDASIKAILQKLIAEEKPDHILSDQAITEILKQKGIEIARRTVAKYREALRIPPSYQRQGQVVSTE